jgi:hypothetical protein
MTDFEIIDKLKDMKRRYDIEEWTLYDLQGDLEDIFMELEKRDRNPE